MSVHFRYLRTVVAASLLAASALARTNSTFATSQVEPLTGSQSIDNEFRGMTAMTASFFREKILKSTQRYSTLGLVGIAASIVPHLLSGMTPNEYAAICKMKLGSQNLLTDTSWIKWAYFVCNQRVNGQMEPYRKIILAMKEFFTPEDLDIIFERALQTSQTRVVAAPLLEHEPIINHRLTRIMLDKIDRRDFFCVRFHQWVNYIELQSGTQNREAAVFVELMYLIDFYGETDLVQILTSRENQNELGQKYLEALSVIWLNKKKSPVDVVDMVVRTERDVCNFLYGGFKAFSPRVWVSYHLKYYEIYRNEAQTVTLLDTLTSAVGPARVAIILRLAQKSPDSSAREWGRYFQNEQYKEWFTKGLTHEAVYKTIANDLTIHPWEILERYHIADYVGNEYAKAIHNPGFEKKQEARV
ncbi:hypothetical protein Plhal710r2_c054g0161751 [Plasmopara halstedii]